MMHIKFDYGEGNEGGRFSDCLRGMTAYLIKNIKGGRDFNTLIRNGKVFNTAWKNPTVPTTEDMKVIL